MFLTFLTVARLMKLSCCWSCLPSRALLWKTRLELLNSFRKFAIYAFGVSHVLLRRISVTTKVVGLLFLWSIFEYFVYNFVCNDFYTSSGTSLKHCARPWKLKELFFCSTWMWTIYWLKGWRTQTKEYCPELFLKIKIQYIKSFDHL